MGSSYFGIIILIILLILIGLLPFQPRLYFVSTTVVPGMSVSPLHPPPGTPPQREFFAATDVTRKLGSASTLVSQGWGLSLSARKDFISKAIGGWDITEYEKVRQEIFDSDGPAKTIAILDIGFAYSWFPHFGLSCDSADASPPVPDPRNWSHRQVQKIHFSGETLEVHAEFRCADNGWLAQQSSDADLVLYYAGDNRNGHARADFFRRRVAAFPVGRLPHAGPTALHEHIAESKMRWIELLLSHGVPQRYLPISVGMAVALGHENSSTSTSDVPSDASIVARLRHAGITLPFVIKVSGFSSGSGVTIVKTEAGVAALLMKAQRLGGLLNPPQPALVQEAVLGDVETTVNFASVAGKVVDVIVFRVVFGDGLYVKGIGDKRKSARVLPRGWQELSPAAQQMVTAVIRKSRIDGIGCLQYKEPTSVDVKLIEINPRPCGSLVTRGHLPTLIHSYHRARRYLLSQLPFHFSF